MKKETKFNLVAFMTKYSMFWLWLAACCSAS